MAGVTGPGAVPPREPYEYRRSEGSKPGESTLAPVFQQGIEHSAQNRMQKCTSLPPKQIRLLRSLGRDLDDLDLQVRNYKHLEAEANANPQNRELQRQAQIERQALQEQIDAMKERYPELDLPTDILNSIFGPSMKAHDFAVFKETMMNKVVDKLAYRQQLDAEIKANLPQLVEAFCPKIVDPSQVTYEIIDDSGDPHNQGKTAVILQFKEGGRDLFKAVYKPRSAEVDQRVLQLFSQINDLPLDERSSTTPLPTYKILQSENGSFHEFIEGDCPGETTSAGAYQRMHYPQNKELEQHLQRMDAILTRAQVGDLHGENIIVMDHETDHPSFFPIDLENLKKSRPDQTFLDTDHKRATLTSQEEALIARFNTDTDRIAFRALPVGTLELATLIFSHKGIERATRVIMQRCQEDNYDMTISASQLQSLIVQDVLHQDIPYFTEYNGILYYGHPSDNHPIARRQE